MTLPLVFVRSISRIWFSASNSTIGNEHAVTPPNMYYAIMGV